MAGSHLKNLSRSLHEARGSGSASRIRLNAARLEEAGWKIVTRKSGNRMHFTYVDPDGRKFKSSKDVERKLEADGILDRFVKENSPEIIDSQVSTHKDSGKDSDEDYEPPVKKKTTECLAKSG